MTNVCHRRECVEMCKAYARWLEKNHEWAGQYLDNIGMKIYWPMVRDKVLQAGGDPHYFDKES